MIDIAGEMPSVKAHGLTLAQALMNLRESRPADELKRAVAKLRVYAISDQDDAGRHEVLHPAMSDGFIHILQTFDRSCRQSFWFRRRSHREQARIGRWKVFRINW